MSLLGKFLWGGRSKAYSEGVSLLEEGNFVEAIDRLRVVALNKSDSPSGALVSFHFRQALVGEGRRLMRLQRFAEAQVPLAEATQLWDLYPDLHCLHGTACGFAGDWGTALSEARTALRINGDYVESRLLETVALAALDRTREAADSLNSLLESGRRVGHWIITSLETDKQFTAATLPPDLDKLLLQGLSGRSEKEEVAAAVALCRGGNWTQGLEKFAELVAKRPRYPDYRTRLAAALFQTGLLDEALVEVDAALALNESYLTAIDLKGLILADQGLIFEARKFLTKADQDLTPSQRSTGHEELFGAYLRATLALLAGDSAAVHAILDGWPDLVRSFAKAELLLAAADDLDGRSSTCGRRLADLADEWSAEPLYFHLLACHHLENRRYRDVAGVLSHWPASDQPDLRPQYLEGCLAVCQGQIPGSLGSREAEIPSAISAAAWEFLDARASFLAQKDSQCWEACQALISRGYNSERVLRLQLAAACNLPEGEAAEWHPEGVLPESCLPGAVYQAVLRGDRSTLDRLLKANTEAHPDFLKGYWLSPGFWLDPIRSWIA